MSEVGIFRKVELATEPEIIVHCKQRPLSEHMWAYFEFSYDPTFKDPDKLVIPDAGAQYDLLTSQNGKYWEKWTDNINVSQETYERQYKIAGYVPFVKAKVDVIPAQTVPSFATPLYVRLTVGRV